MSRCVICDYCRETDGGNREVTWSRKENGFVCSSCRDAIFYSYVSPRPQAVYDFDKEGEGPLLDEDFDAADISVEGLDILEESGVEKDSS